jgi:methionyl-tRNA formyltransferase
VSGSPGRLRLALLASGSFALPALAALLGGGDELALVISAPPAPAGRGRALAPTLVSAAAREAGLPVLETAKVNSPEALEAIGRARPDLLCVAAFRGFLGARLLATGAAPPLNIHPSLLPRHRGPAPVNWTLIRGDAKCGVSVCQMGRRMDAGPVVAQAERPVPEGLPAGRLEDELAVEGAALLLAAIGRLKAGTLAPVEQDEALATVNPLMAKGDGLLDFARPAFEVARRINGVDPWPGAQARGGGRSFKLFEALAAAGEGRPGQILGPAPPAGERSAGRLLIACGQGAVAVSGLQPEGKSRLTAAEFSRGYRLEAFEPGPPAAA